MRSTTRELDGHVRRMLEIARERHPDFERDCLTDPDRLVEHWTGRDLHFRYVDHLDNAVVDDPNTVFEEGGRTSDLSGLFTLALPPKRVSYIKVRYAANDYTARRNFTLLHEIGHYLQQTDDELVNNLCGFAASYDEKLFEESACNRFASLSLLPTGYIRESLGDGRLTSKKVGALFESGRGRGRDQRKIRVSRPVVVRRMAEFLGTGGAIALVSNRSLTRVHWNGDVDYAEEGDDPFAQLTDAERRVYAEFQSSRPRGGTLELDVRGELGGLVHSSVTISYGQDNPCFIVTDSGTAAAKGQPDRHAPA